MSCHITVLAREAVGGGGVVLALEPAALEAGPVVPDVDRTHRDIELAWCLGVKVSKILLLLARSWCEP